MIKKGSGALKNQIKIPGNGPTAVPSRRNKVSKYPFVCAVQWAIAGGLKKFAAADPSGSCVDLAGIS